ncbi:MAG: hypothetical protein A2Y81_09820 [Nitrospirae bacterium RBG_13_43_8]|nr:MAG: hypothetical protein A2Y81_09820 [Nitrospirae bacterium RBG_13_43_8]
MNCNALRSLPQGYIIVPSLLRGEGRERVIVKSFFHPPLNPLPSREGVSSFISDALRSLPQGSSEYFR